jgi:hypothetical protein
LRSEMRSTGRANVNPRRPGMRGRCPLKWRGRAFPPPHSGRSVVGTPGRSPPARGLIRRPRSPRSRAPIKVTRPISFFSCALSPAPYPSQYGTQFSCSIEPRGICLPSRGGQRLYAARHSTCPSRPAHNARIHRGPSWQPPFDRRGPGATGGGQMKKRRRQHLSAVKAAKWREIPRELS